MYIDANIFLELFLDQKKAQECEDFLESVRKGDLHCITSDFSIDTILLTLYRQTKDVSLLEKFLLTILDYTGLSIYFTTIEDRLNSIRHIETLKLDFEDSLTFQAAISSRCKKIVSFDRDFDDLPIKRIEPKDVF